MPSLKKIAQELDVSYTLVSKVLSGKMGTTGVSPSVRGRIIQKAKELNYTPNRLAVALKAGRKDAVAVFLHEIGVFGSGITEKMIRGISSQLSHNNLRMQLRLFASDEEFFAACDDRLKHEVDGLIIGGVFHPGIIQSLVELEDANLPCVSIFSAVPHFSHSSISNVHVDWQHQTYLTTSHLLKSGCRHLACFSTMHQRSQGFFKAHEDARIPYDRQLLVPAAGFELEDGLSCIKQLLNLKIPFDGIVCQSDNQAIVAINELVLRGIKVPDTVKVTGVDDSPLAPGCIVPLTSATNEMDSAAAMAVRILMEKLAGRPSSSIVIEPNLAVRKSSGGLP
jgi:LacI family transcriptional regulator